MWLLSLLRRQDAEKTRENSRKFQEETKKKKKKGTNADLHGTQRSDEMEPKLRGMRRCWENRIRALMSEAPKRVGVREAEALEWRARWRTRAASFSSILRGCDDIHPYRIDGFSLRAQARLHKIQQNFRLIISSPTATNATLHSQL